jgi:hypothetical protein
MHGCLGDSLLQNYIRIGIIQRAYPLKAEDEGTSGTYKITESFFHI